MSGEPISAGEVEGALFGIPLDGTRALLANYGTVIAVLPQHVVLTWMSGYAPNKPVTSMVERDKVLLTRDRELAHRAGAAVWSAHQRHAFDLRAADERRKGALSAARQLIVQERQGEPSSG